MTGGQFNWVEHMEAIAGDIFGESNSVMSRPPEDVRFGQHGSVSVNYNTGQWFDFENKRGGGVRELIRVYREIEDHDAAMLYATACRDNLQNGQNPRSNGNAGTNQQHQREVQARYPYHDASGQVAFEVVRYVFRQNDGTYVTDGRGKRLKAFGQRRPSGEPDKKWLWGLDAGDFMRRGPGKDWFRFNAVRYDQFPTGKERKVFNTAVPSIPYGLPELLQALATKQVVCIPEGEKKVESVRLLGFAATCSAGGARKWRPEHSALLAGADVVLIPDNDAAGRAHVEAIAESLIKVARRVRVLDLPKNDYVRAGILKRSISTYAIEYGGRKLRRLKNSLRKWALRAPQRMKMRLENSDPNHKSLWSRCSCQPNLLTRACASILSVASLFMGSSALRVASLSVAMACRTTQKCGPRPGYLPLGMVSQSNVCAQLARWYSRVAGWACT
jgi:hypothetical protein